MPRPHSSELVWYGGARVSPETAMVTPPDAPRPLTPEEESVDDPDDVDDDIDDTLPADLWF